MLFLKVLFPRSLFWRINCLDTREDLEGTNAIVKERERDRVHSLTDITGRRLKLQLGNWDNFKLTNREKPKLGISPVLSHCYVVFDTISSVNILSQSNLSNWTENGICMYVYRHWRNGHHYKIFPSELQSIIQKSSSSLK